MSHHNLSARVREELQALIDSPPFSPSDLPEGLRQLAQKERIPIYATLLSLATHLQMSEGEARRHWEALSSHRADLEACLGRDPGLRVAAMDYFLNRETCLSRPKVVDQSVLARIEESSVGDGMTPLFNHRHFLSSLRCELRRCRRHPLEFSLVLLDLDGLGTVNDSCGRRAGDSALAETARVIQARVREMDVAARSGGGEFSLLLPGTARLGAYVAADRIRASTRELFLQTPHGMDRINLTLSGGVAVYPSDGESEEDLLEKAGLALRKARARGGDIIIPYYGEKRDSFRFRPVGAVLQARAVDGADPPGPLLRTRNLSAGGALFTSPAAHPVGEDLEIQFSRRESDSGLILKASVLRREDRGPEEGEAQTRVAVRFLLESPGARQALDTFLTSLRGHGIEEGAP